MEINIVTLAFNRPDFIELQLNSLKKWVPNFNYTVYDNCPDDAIKDECERLGVKCIPIKIFSADPSWCFGFSFHQIWEILQYEKGTLMYIDSDMFLVGEIPDIADHDFAFVPQTRSGGIIYPWTGLMIFNMDTLPHPEELKWEVDYDVRLNNADVGGRNHFYLLEHNPKRLELEIWTLAEPGKTFCGTDVVSSHENFTKMEKICVANDFPPPYTVDMLKVKGESFEKCFVFHYKSASNYPSFYTPEYNRLKTIALKKYLCQ